MICWNQSSVSITSEQKAAFAKPQVLVVVTMKLANDIFRTSNTQHHPTLPDAILNSEMEQRAELIFWTGQSGLDLCTPEWGLRSIFDSGPNLRNNRDLPFWDAGQWLRVLRRSRHLYHSCLFVKLDNSDRRSYLKSDTRNMLSSER